MKEGAAGDVQAGMPWAAEPGRAGVLWADHDRVASAMLDSQPRTSPAGMSATGLQSHESALSRPFEGDRASQEADLAYRHTEALTEANVSARNMHMDR